MHIVLIIGLLILVVGVGPLISLILLENLGLIKLPDSSKETPQSKLIVFLGFLAMVSIPVGILLMLIGGVFTLI
ncbi:hypothetical protein [Aureispira anguillae]|uniref:Uncharacterized protein n=1 Tax=Aureispira anguillae TaxID=2864201 RepID=A0A915YF91_9BACT|nr:hypothetical protein [Aureispira anguillae]BDS12044.1 hypothetical protein AsAng_0027590 [Aureispira anguillae]